MLKMLESEASRVKFVDNFDVVNKERRDTVTITVEHIANVQQGQN